MSTCELLFYNSLFHLYLTSIHAFTTSRDDVISPARALAERNSRATYLTPSGHAERADPWPGAAEAHAPTVTLPRNDAGGPPERRRLLPSRAREKTNLPAGAITGSERTDPSSPPRAGAEPKPWAVACMRMRAPGSARRPAAGATCVPVLCRLALPCLCLATLVNPAGRHRLGVRTSRQVPAGRLIARRSHVTWKRLQPPQELGRPRRPYNPTSFFTGVPSFPIQRTI